MSDSGLFRKECLESQSEVHSAIKTINLSHGNGRTPFMQAKFPVVSCMLELAIFFCYPPYTVVLC